MFCTYCGSAVEDNNNFCGHCGKRARDAQPPETGSADINRNAQIGPGAGVPPARAYFGNNPGNMQTQGYNTGIPAARKYSHSLTLSLIVIVLYLVTSILSYNVLFTNYLLRFILLLIQFLVSTAALVLGAVHLRKRSCAAGGLILGISFAFALLFDLIIYGYVLLNN